MIKWIIINWTNLINWIIINWIATNWITIKKLISKKLIYISLFILSFSLHSCVYIITQEIKSMEDFYNQQNDTTGKYTIPIFNTNITNLESLKNKTIFDSNSNQVRIIDTITNLDTLKNIRPNYKIDTVEKIEEKTDTSVVIKQVIKQTRPKSHILEKDKTIITSTVITTTTFKTDTSSVIEQNQYEEKNKYEIAANITTINSAYYPDSIIINAIVYDNKGSFISGLAAPYLATDKTYKDYWKPIIDSCKNEKYIIEDFVVEEIRDLTSPPYSICFVLDHSPSMGNERCLALQQSVRYSMSKVKDGDYLSAIKFTSNPTVEVLPTNNKEIFKRQFLINGMDRKYGAGTDILLALDSAIEILKNLPEKYQKIIILFTDGESSQTNYNKIVNKARNNHIRVFTVCYGRTDFLFMEKLAKDTDGRMFFLKNIKEFAKVFQYIYNTLTNYYKITYNPPICNDLHTVKLELGINELGFANISSSGQYDKSIFNDFIDIGTVTLVDIEFEYNKSTISNESLDMLFDISEQLKRNEQIRIQICGHTDDKGSDDYNMQLSLARANAVKNQLIKLGISEKRLATKGFGKTQPIVPNDSEENRKKNRRTEFIVIE